MNSMPESSDFPNKVKNHWNLLNHKGMRDEGRNYQPG